LKNIIYILLLIAVSPLSTLAQQDFFDRTQLLLDRYVSNEGKVNYTALREDDTYLADAVYDIAHSNLDGRSMEYRTAFYINAYNVLVIRNVVDNWPLESPLDVKGFFDVLRFNVAGEMMTLNQLENEKLRKDDGDPRIHFALVCAASSCPPLSRNIIVPRLLRNLLQDMTRKALDTELMVRVDHPRKTIYLSKIFEWYAADFGGGEDGIRNFINGYRLKPLPPAYELDYQAYDWSVNGQ
jgi:hypothetical protein